MVAIGSYELPGPRSKAHKARGHMKPSDNQYHAFKPGVGHLAVRVADQYGMTSEICLQTNPEKGYPDLNRKYFTNISFEKNF